MALLGSAVMVLMLLPRREMCSRFGSLDRWRSADIEEMSLYSRVSVVILLESGRVIVVSWLADAVSEMRAGNRDDTSAICVRG